MARKVVNRKALREEVETAERAEKKAAKKTAAKGATKTAKKKPAKRKSRAKVPPEDVRMKLYWGVFNQSLKRVALYDFNQKKQAEKKAEALSQSGKSPHFVQKVKEEVQE